MKLIVATNNLGYIGKDGKMLWYSSDDLKHFKQLTTGCSLIVGATTFEICLNGKLLPNRETFILGKKYKSIWEILGTICRLAQEEKDIWVIGGSMVYNTFIHLCDEVHISHINNNEIGDTKFVLPTDYKGKVFDYYFEETKR